MIVIRDFTFQYQSADRPALSALNLTVQRGDFVGVIGSSGAGKTTLTYALNGIVPHHFRGDFYGEVLVDGLDTVETRPEQLSRLVGSVFQDVDAQMVAPVVEDELLFGLENFGVPHAEIEARLTAALREVGIEELRERSIGTLSGGQKQKVAIAAIIALQPELIVLDEPTGELDPQSSRQIFEMLRELNRKHGITIVVVEQKIMLLSEFVSKLLVLDRGSVAFYDEVHDVLEHCDELMALGINVPRIVSLHRELAERGLYQGLPPVNLTEAKAMVEAVIGC